MPDADRRCIVITNEHSEGGLGGTLRGRKPYFSIQLRAKVSTATCPFQLDINTNGRFWCCRGDFGLGGKNTGTLPARGRRGPGTAPSGFGLGLGCSRGGTAGFGLTTLGVRHLEHVFFKVP